MRSGDSTSKHSWTIQNVSNWTRPTFPAVARRGVVLSRLGRDEEASADLEMAADLLRREMKQGTKVAHLLKSMVGAYLETGRCDEAGQLLQEVLAIPPNEAAPQHGCGDRPCFTCSSPAGAAEVRRGRDLVPSNRSRSGRRSSPRTGGRTTPRVFWVAASPGRRSIEEAEPLLLVGYQGMKQRENKMPVPAKLRITEALDGLIQLYDDWGKPEEAEKWRQLREAKSATVEASPAVNDPATEPQADKGE